MKKVIGKILKITLTTVIFIAAYALPALATDQEADGDVLNVMDNMTELIFGVVRAIGIGFAAWGFLNFGTSFSSHDSSQRATGLSNIAGGLFMIFAKQILKSIGAF